MSEPSSSSSSRSSNAASSSYSSSNLEEDLNEITQATKLRKMATSEELTNLQIKRNAAMQAILSNVRKLYLNDELQNAPSAPEVIARLATTHASALTDASIEELDAMIRHAKATPTADGILEALLEVGVFSTASAAQDYLQLGSLSESAFIQRFVDERGYLGALMIAAILHHYPLDPVTAYLRPTPRSITEAMAKRYAKSGLYARARQELRDRAQKAVELAITRSKVVDDFFSMKLSQPLDNIVGAAKSSEVIFRESCPLFSNYDNGRLIGAGAFGVALKYARRDTLMAKDGVPLFCVVKIQAVRPSILPTDELEGSLRELMVMHTIESALKLPHDRPFLSNHVRLYDWTRCRMNLTEALKPILNAEDLEKIKGIRGAQLSAINTYQIIVEEYAPEGELDEVLSKQFSSEIFLNTKAICSMFTQVFGFFYALYASRGFAHNDLKPPNILLKRLPPNSTIKYLVYNFGPNRASYYVPVADSSGFVFKVADFGLADITTKEGKKIGRSEWKAQPGLDLEMMACTVLFSIIEAYKKDYRVMMPAEALRLLRQMIVPPNSDTVDRYVVADKRSDASLAKVPTSGKLREAALAFLAEENLGKEAPDYIYHCAVYDEMYGMQMAAWGKSARYAAHRSMDSIDKMLATVGRLTDYDITPKDLTPNNYYVMNAFEL